MLKFFSSAKRNLIVYNIVNRVRVKRGPRVYSGYRELLSDEIFTDFWAVHTGPAKIPKVDGKIDTEASPRTNSRKRIHDLMDLGAKTFLKIKSLFVFMPLKEIKEYFGEYVAFYFAVRFSFFI